MGCLSEQYFKDAFWLGDSDCNFIFVTASRLYATLCGSV